MRPYTDSEGKTKSSLSIYQSKDKLDLGYSLAICSN